MKRRELLTIGVYWYAEMWFRGWRGWIPRIRSMSSRGDRWRFVIGHLDIHFESTRERRKMREN